MPVVTRRMGKAMLGEVLTHDVMGIIMDHLTLRDALRLSHRFNLAKYFWSPFLPSALGDITSPEVTVAKENRYFCVDRECDQIFCELSSAGTRTLTLHAFTRCAPTHSLVIACRLDYRGICQFTSTVNYSGPLTAPTCTLVLSFCV